MKLRYGLEIFNFQTVNGNVEDQRWSRKYDWKNNCSPPTSLKHKAPLTILDKHLRPKRSLCFFLFFLSIISSVSSHACLLTDLIQYFVNCNPPSLGKTMRYSALHWGQATRAVLLPRCFSSTQRCKQDWWTHLVEPRHRHGRTHSAVRSSSSVAKHTQQLLKQMYTATDQMPEITHTDAAERTLLLLQLMIKYQKETTSFRFMW